MPRLWIASTRQDWQPRYSPDGTKIAFGSTRSGAREIWIADADGSSPVQRTSFGGPLVGFMNWSPDGRQLVFHARPEGQADLYTTPASGGPPRCLTTDPFDDTGPSYSHDGRWIYFASRRSGQGEIWKMPAEGGAAAQLTRSGGHMPEESPDGKALYYCHLLREKGIWKVPVEGGEPVPVTGPRGHTAGLAVTTEGVYYVAPPDSSRRSFVHFHSFRTGQSHPVSAIDGPPVLGLSLSPDGRFLLFAGGDQIGSDLMMIENFQARF